eukprot:g15213.t1
MPAAAVARAGPTADGQVASSPKGFCARDIVARAFSLVGLLLPSPVYESLTSLGGKAEIKDMQVLLRVPGCPAHLHHVTLAEGSYDSISAATKDRSSDFFFLQANGHACGLFKGCLYDTHPLFPSPLPFSPENLQVLHLNPSACKLYRLEKLNLSKKRQRKKQKRIQKQQDLQQHKKQRAGSGPARTRRPPALAQAAHALFLPLPTTGTTLLTTGRTLCAT